MSAKSLLKKSYLLTGVAGSGKSSILKNDYLKHISKKSNLKESAYLFLNSVEIINIFNNEDKKNQLLKNLDIAKYNNIFLYLDGVDEIGEENCKLLFDFVESVETMAKKIVFKITCRPEFAEKHIRRSVCFSRIQYKKVKISNWSTSSLKSFAKQLKKNLNKNNYESFDDINNVYKDIIKNLSWTKYVNSPLLMKLFVYMKLQSDYKTKIKFENKYAFYEQFIYILIKTYFKRQNNPILPSDIENMQNAMADLVFKCFCTGSKQLQITKHLNTLNPILKEVSEGEVCFVHETFFEYYVARQYLSKLKSESINMDTLSVFYRNYSNDFADFISDAININDEKTKLSFFTKLSNIYCYTLEDKVKADFDRYTPEFNDSINHIISKLSDEELFSLKYEIIFRLGRLGINDQQIIDFLELVYYYDDNTKQLQPKEYYEIVLKRCCAISSSFLGGEKIEIEYVRHMLPFYDTYIDNYDLANRSHTLLFYGDAKHNNIFTFYDDDVTVSCNNAFNKRLECLSAKLSKDVFTMNKKEKKKYYFRLFDLATIYTFMYNRKRSLSLKEFIIILKCKVSFNNSSKERTKLMCDIKEKIIKLNKVQKKSKN